ncbi:MAG: response regulator [Lachnospiraceae bacterium]|nr:response regulator [Lachnospiraceae bacterium]
MKVLLVEDNVYKAVDFTKALKSLFPDHLEICEAEDRETAQEYLERQKFDLVLLDMFFPDCKGGYEEPWCGLKILDYLKEKPYRTPVICTSTVRCSLMDYPDCIGQVVYGKDETDFRLKELVDQIPYLF